MAGRGVGRWYRARRGCLAFLLVHALPLGAAGPPFGNPQKLSLFGLPVVVADPAGTLAVAWIDTASSNDLVYCRSWDGGSAWSAPASLAGGRGREIDLAAADVWVAAWVGDAGGVFAARSPDGGRHWDPPVFLAFDGRGVRVATDGHGTWVVSWIEPSSPSQRVVVARSADDAASWLAPAVVFEAAEGMRVEPGRVASDGAGTWLAAWRDGPLGDDAIAIARSVDGAASWKMIGPPIGSPKSGLLDLGAEGGGRWLLAWSRAEEGVAFPFIVPDASVVVARSDDDGRSWMQPLDVDAGRRMRGLFTGFFDSDVQLARQGPGRWIVVWSSTLIRSGEDHYADVLMARSTNGGLTWTRPERLNGTLDDPDRSHIAPRVAATAAGGTIVAWSSNDRLRGGIAPDDPFGVLVARSLACAPQPLSGCQAADGAGAHLSFDSASGRRPARFRWKWRRESGTDFGEPTIANDYLFCVYGPDGGALLFESALPAGGFCGRQRCWRSERFGEFVYRAGRSIAARANRAVLATTADESRITLGGAGVQLTRGTVPFPSLPVALPLLAQLQQSNGACWQSQHLGAARNSAARFSSP